MINSSRQELHAHYEKIERDRISLPNPSGRGEKGGFLSINEDRDKKEIVMQDMIRLASLEEIIKK